MSFASAPLLIICPSFPLSSDDEPISPPPASGLSQTSSGVHGGVRPTPPPPPPPNPLYAGDAGSPSTPRRARGPRDRRRLPRLLEATPPRGDDTETGSLASSSPNPSLSIWIRSPARASSPGPRAASSARFACPCGSPATGFVSDFASSAVGFAPGGIPHCISVRCVLLLIRPALWFVYVPWWDRDFREP